MNLKNATPQEAKRILLIGNSGTGKTSFCATMPEPYVADFDNGLTSIMGRDVECDQFHESNPDLPDAYKRFKAVLKEWQKEPKRKTFCVDGLTMLGGAIFSWAMKENGRLGQQPQQGDWGKAISEVQKTLAAISTLKCHVVVTAHLQVEKDELLGGISYLPNIYGRALPGTIPLYFDEVYRTHAESKIKDSKTETSYRIQVRPDQRYVCLKSGMNRLNCFDVNEEPDFSKLLAKYSEAYEQFKTQGAK